VFIAPPGALPAASAANNPGQVEVPGGVAAVARFVGHVDHDPERFIASLNEQLLSATRTDHDWRSIPRRDDLHRFLDLVAELERRFPAPIRIDAADERRTAERLADALGFVLVEDRRRGFVLMPKKSDDDEQAFRRRAAQALGIGVESIGDRLDAGESRTLALVRDRAPSPLPPDLWARASGRPLGPDALATLVEDQSLGLLLAGYVRLSDATRARMEQVDLRFLHQRAPFAFRRYASSFTIEHDRLVTPGGDAALPVWRDLAAARNDSPEELLQRLLVTERAKGAFLWHALRFAPPPAVDYFVGRGGGGAGPSPLRRLHDRLDESSGAFDGSQMTRPGFETLARSLPFDEDPPRPRLPGGPGLWLAAIDGDPPPATLEQTQAVIRDRPRDSSDHTAVVLHALIADVSRSGPNASAMPRLLRGASFFAEHPALYSPENVILVARGSDTFAPALRVLDVLDPASPEVARDYLLAVSRLLRLDVEWPRQQLVIAFQGGVEWLRVMAAAGRVERGALERELARWSAIHQRHDSAAAATPEELAWVTRLLRALPQAPDGAPGRGPYERAMLQAMVAATEPGLHWTGLDYDSDRPRRLAATMAETLAFFEVPAADLLVGLDDALADLASRCREEDLEGARRAATTLRAQLARLPSPARSLALPADDLARQIDNPERDQAVAVAVEVLARSRPKGLAELAPRVEEAARFLAGDLRPFLAAPAYLVPLAEGRGPLLQDPSLLRRHQVLCVDPTRNRAWAEATVQRGDEDRPGLSICGHLGTVDAGIASFALSTASLRTGDGLDELRAQAWFRSLIATRWQDLDPKLTGAAAEVMALGRALLDRAVDQTRAPGGGPHLALATTFVPRARLENAARQPPPALLSPAEAWMIGALAVERASGDPALAGLDHEHARAHAAIGAIGPDWRERLDRVGIASPSLNGRSMASLEWWPPYEAIDLDGRNQALVERELVDLHLLVVGYLGRQGLPGFVGSDLMRRTMEDLVSTLELGHERDWESVLRALLRIDDRYFEARMRECLRQGLYQLREL
jgi:hypothetical protein